MTVPLLRALLPDSTFIAQDIDPEYEQHRKEAEDANEVLALRSMGIRTALEKKRYVTRAPSGLSW